MKKNSLKTQELIAPTVQALGYELIGCVYATRGRHSLLRVYIDNEKGVTVDDCQAVSRQVSALLDVEDPIASQYTLEVSSPGMDRPLFVPAHYQRFIGQMARIHLHVPLNGRRNFKGLIKAVTDNVVTIEVNNEHYELPFTHIEKANLEPLW